MSQSTVDNLLNTLGLAPVQVDAEMNQPTRSTVDSAVTPSRRKHVAIALISAMAFGVGFKLIGDYACDVAIDAWAARESAQYTLPSPIVLKYFETSGEEETAQESPTSTEPGSVSLGE